MNCSSSSYYGGAVYWYGSEGILANCSFVNCSSSRWGAVYWGGSNGSLVGCSFVNCSSSRVGAVYWLGSNGSLVGCSFVNCSASIGKGNFVYWWAKNGNISNCSFDGDRYNYGLYCFAYEYKFDPNLNINVNDTRIGELNKIFISVSPVVNNITIKIYNATNGKIIQQFSLSIFDELSLFLNNLTYGNYSCTVECYEDNLYRSKSITKYFKVKKHSPIINATDIIGVMATNNVIYNVSLNDDANGTIQIIMYNKTFEGTVINGKCMINITNLFGGIYNFTINYSGDSKYDYLIFEKLANVNFKNSSIDFEIYEGIKVWEPIHICPIVTSDATGNIAVYIDGLYYRTFEVGKTVNLGNLNAGNHSLTLIYNGDNYFKGSEKTKLFNIYKLDTNITTSFDSLIAGNTIINVSVDNNATGTITININQKNYTKTLDNGEISFCIDDLISNEYNFTIFYFGDQNFNQNNLSESIFVQKKKSEINISADNISSGEVAKFKYNITQGASGIISIYIDNVFFKNVLVGDEIELVNLNDGKHNIKMVYNSNGFYDKCENNIWLTVFKNTFIKLDVIEINLNESFEFNPIVTAGATGNLDIYVDGIYKTNIHIGNTYNLSGFDGGNHTIKVVYSGDDYYTSCENTTILKVNKINTTISVSSVNMIAGNTILSVTLNNKATGTIILNVNNKNYTEKLSNGKATFYIYDLPIGGYNYTIFYSGDQNFNKNNVRSTIVIEPKQSKITISSGSVYLDEIASIDYNLTSGATGILSIYANDTFIKNVTVGEEIEIEGLKAGIYTIMVVYNSDGYFATCENTTELEIYKLNSYYYIDGDIIAGDNIVFDLIFYEDATGKINISFGEWDFDEYDNEVWIGKYNCTCQLINGKTTITIPNLIGGWQEYIISYEGDERYAPLKDDDYIYVEFRDSPINVNIPEINWADTVKFTSNLPKGATGNIELLIDNISLANFSIGNSYSYNAVIGGKHYLTIKYSGDDYYIDNETTIEFYVNKLNSTFNIENTFDADEYITIPITLANDANGYITVNINNNIYSGYVVNGSFTFTVIDLGAGANTAVINYTNDIKYNDLYIAKEITVNLKNPNLNLDIGNILENQNLLIKPTLRDGATGMIDIYVDNALKSTINAGSSYTLQKPGLGQHKIKLVYCGNKYFKSTEQEYSFRVFKFYPIESMDTQIVYGTNKKFQAKFYDEYGEVLANKYVLFIVNGTEYPIKTNSEGIAILDVNLDVGEYNVTSVSLLDESTINKLLIFHSVNAQSMIIEYGSDTRFSATFLDETAKPLSNTNIVFNIDGKDTMVKTDVNGVAILNQELSIGTHTITSINTVTDENMTNNVVVVSDIDSIITLDVNDINYTQKAILKVNIDPNYLNANIVIKVTGENGYEQIFIQKASKTITKEFTNLNASKYQVDVKYESSNLFVIQKNASFNVLKIDPIMTVNIDDGVIDHDLTLTIAIPNATGNVEVKINGRTYELQLVNGSVVKRLSNLVIGQNSVEIFYKGDNNHNPLIKTNTFKVWNNFELDIDFASELDQDIGEYYISIYNLGEDVNKECLTLLIDGVKVDQEVIYSYDDEDKCYIRIEFYVSDLTAGTHTWKINYFDAANYINASKSDSFTVTIPPEPDTYQIAFIDNKSIIYVPFDKIKWNAKVVPVYYDLYEEYINYNFSTFTINGVEYNIVVSQLVSTASIYVSFNPNDYKKYDEIFYKVDNGQIVDVIDCMHYEVFGNEYYRFVGSGYKVFSENIGEVSYCIVNNNVYKIIGTMGASNAFFYDAVVNVDYKKVNGKYYTLNGEIISELTTSIPKGEIINSTFYVIDGNRYIPHNIWALGYEYISVNNSLFRVIYSEYDEKTYDRNTYALVDGILYSVDGNVVDKPVSIDMTQPIEDLTIPDLNNPSSDGSVIIELPSDATGSVTLTVNGKDYSFEVVNGVANIVLPNLTNGDYNYTIAYSGDIKYSSFVTNGTMTVNKTSDKPVENTTVEPEITIPPLDEPSDDGSVVVKLPVDATGIVTLSINGKDYHFAVVNGIANVIVPDLGEGNYPYTITYSGDSKYSSFTTFGSLNKTAPKVDPLIIAKNTVVQYSAKGKYSVTVYGTDGKVASNVEVVFKISDKQVAKVKTNVEGVASYVVTKNPGIYKIKATALGKSITNTLTVKHIVTLKTVTIKKSAKKLTLQASLAKVNGKYLKKQKITFKINGKKVATAKTNTKGVAKITIKNPGVVKKLKLGKKVTYQAIYLGDTVQKTTKIKK